jgi:UDP-N-acetylglucosamine 2-epimerase (non-hydrolysing)
MLLFSWSLIIILNYKTNVLNTKQKSKLVTIAGNRPEIIKLSELVKLLGNQYENLFVYTGQHYSQNMRDVFLKELNVKFDYDLMCGTSDLDILRKNICELLQTVRSKYVIVYGDTNTTLAGALAAKDVGCKLIHLEAGLRSFDLTTIEEKNRIQTDSIADYHLAPTELSKTFLKYEIPTSKPYVTGNLIVDVCRKYSSDNQKLSIRKNNNIPKEYVLLTLHRQENVDDENMLRQIKVFLAMINYTIVFPVHPRTINNLTKYKIQLPSNVVSLDALGYREFLALLKNCAIVITDSGGVQEEAIILKKPCITINNSTERQETLLLKANRIFFPLYGERQKNSINDTIEEMTSTKITTNPYGENVTKRSFAAIQDIIDGTNHGKYEEEIRIKLAS